ncbi:MAG: DnaJ domain-containing protein [Telmatospirillum sp.]|nr:DnaJ domain-containing protein [Telmatospirillum sp.]
MYWGKIIGTLAGFGLGHGLLGAVAGAAVGHWADLRLARLIRGDGPLLSRRAEKQRIFSTSVVSLAAKLSKADGPVTRHEVDAFKAEFVIPPSERAGIAAIFDDARRDARDFEPHARRLAAAFGSDRALLAEVLDSLTRVATADGPLTPPEIAFLKRVTTIFGLPERQFGGRSVVLVTSNPYDVLGVAPGSPMTEIKAAWRRLTRENHPDTLMAKGMPADHVAFATRKMAEINAAYDRIRAERGDA